MSAPLLIACAATTLALGLPVLGGASALETRHRVAAAADSAALAAADAAGGWISADPCALAAEVAAATSVSLSECSVDDNTGVATVVVQASTVLGVVAIHARAGPAGIE
ncbi:Rv3654c family TadE-like protein [Leucobacter sp. W1038]|uniref:Rv3654c family TadE-like protein n=1 Tax=Leucobacter sp. W1038 TaxID=3438281 RepID=UPI003D99FD29